jgi:hypothetical protein
MSVESRWKYIDRGKPKNLEESLSHCHFAHDKSHMDWHGGEAGPYRREAGG